MSRRRRIQNSQQGRIIINCDSRSLMVVDVEPMRRAEQEKCREILGQIDREREKLRQFNEESQPAFMQWLHLTFGQEITEIRDLAQKLLELQRTILEVEEYRMMNPCSYQEAYEVVESGYSEPEPSVSEDWEPEVPEMEEQFEARDDHDARGGFDEFERLGQKARARFSASQGDGYRPDQRIKAKMPATPPHSRLKELYRDLARRLHPDVNVELDEKRKNLWHQVQEAYENRDVERLETLSLMSGVLDKEARPGQSLGALKEFYLNLCQGLKRLKAQISECRKDPAWKFEKARHHADQLENFRYQMAIQMEDERAELLELVEEAEFQIERWKRPAGKRRRNRGR